MIDKMKCSQVLDLPNSAVASQKPIDSNAFVLLVLLDGRVLIKGVFRGFQLQNDLIRKLATSHFYHLQIDELQRLKIGQTDDPPAAFGEKKKFPRSRLIA